METKKCSKCEQIKPLGRFNKDRGRRRAECKRCQYASQTEHRKKSGHYQKHRKRHLACSHARYAKKIGKLINPEYCEGCGCKEKLEMHHDDYSRPLDVRWLCVSCHLKHHAKMREIALPPGTLGTAHTLPGVSFSSLK